jgi:hypothetical protein
MLREVNAKKSEKSTVCFCNADDNINVKTTVMNYYVTWYAEKNASKPDFYVHLLYRGRNPDKSFKSFPPCYSQSPLQLCPEISIFQAHATSFIFLQTHATSYVYLHYTDRKPHPLPYGLRNPCIQKPQA